MKTHNYFRYERKDFTVVIQPAFTDVRFKVESVFLFQVSSFQLELFMRPDKRGTRQVHFAKESLHYGKHVDFGGLFDICVI